jgi:hypothetical protein
MNYFNSYTNALDYAFNHIGGNHVIKNENFHRQVTFNKKPSLHKTNILTLDLLDDRVKLHIQIYRMNLNTFELNYYVN